MTIDPILPPPPPQAHSPLQNPLPTVLRLSKSTDVSGRLAGLELSISVPLTQGKILVNEGLSAWECERGQRRCTPPTLAAETGIGGGQISEN